MSERLVFGYGARGDGTGTPPHDGRGDAAAAVTSAHEDGRPRRTRPQTDWAFTGLMLFTALLFFRPQDTIGALGALHLAELAALGALGAMVAGRLGRGQQATRFTPELGGVLALGVIILATAPFSIWMGGAISTFTDLFLKVVLIFILMVNTLSSPKRIEQFTWLIVIATGYIASRAVFDYARGLNLIENGRVQGALGGMFRNPNDLALNIVAVLPLAFSLALRPLSAFRRLFALGCVVLMLGAIVATQSRSGALGLAAMALVLGVQVARRRPGLAFAGVLAILLLLPAVPSSYWNRMSSITDASSDDTGSREARSTLLRESFATFLAHPVTGIGAGQFRNYNPDERVQAWRETHNVVLQVAAELGVGGLLVFLFLIGRAAYAPLQTRRLLRRASGGQGKRIGRVESVPAVTPEEHEMLDAHCTAMAAALAGWFVCALFASVAYHWTFYYLLALCSAPRELLADRLDLRQRSRPVSSVRLRTGAAAGVRV